jgi:hypothetical protein
METTSSRSATLPFSLSRWLLFGHMLNDRHTTWTETLWNDFSQLLYWARRLGRKVHSFTECFPLNLKKRNLHRD